VSCLVCRFELHRRLLWTCSDFKFSVGHSFVGKPINSHLRSGHDTDKTVSAGIWGREKLRREWNVSHEMARIYDFHESWKMPAGADLGSDQLGWLVSPWRGSLQCISCYYYACDLSYFDVVVCPSSSQTLKFHSPVSPDALNARLLRSFGFPKSPPLKILDLPMAGFKMSMPNPKFH